MTSPIRSLKQAARVECRRRREAAAAAHPHAAALLRDSFLAALDPAPGTVVSGYWPIGSEIDVRPLLHHLAARGHGLALPVVVERGRPLLFRAWMPGTALEPARLGLSVPPAESPEVDPAVLLVPLLGFDRRGGRLGYGGGFYDRTLARLRAAGPVLAVGVGFAAQELP